MPLLPAAGREYLTATLTDAPADVDVQVSFDDGDTWHDTTRTDDTISVLIAGPDAESNPVETVVLPRGRSRVSVRAVDNPEVVIRHAGAVDVA